MLSHISSTRNFSSSEILRQKKKVPGRTYITSVIYVGFLLFLYSISITFGVNVAPSNYKVIRGGELTKCTTVQK